MKEAWGLEKETVNLYAICEDVLVRLENMAERIMFPWI